MKLGVVGCGAVGSYYGAMLARTGHETHFLLRSDYDVVRRSGVFVQSPRGNFTVSPHCAKTPTTIGHCDLVLVALKTTANEQFSSLLPPLVGPHTAILTLQNGLGNEEQLARLFPPSQILGGLCFVCINRLEPGHIHHLDHGLIVLGEYQRPPSPRTQQIASLLQEASIPCSVTDNLDRAHWEKLVWNIPFNGLGVAGTAGFEAVMRGELSFGRNSRQTLGPCLTTDKLLGAPNWAQLVRELMQEVVGASKTQGHTIPPSVVDAQIERTRSMGPYKASTLIDFELGRPLELESLFLEPLRRALSGNATVPRLAALCRVLTQLDAL
jgi:2-dehydropantoate 2-reductase